MPDQNLNWVISGKDNGASATFEKVGKSIERTGKAAKDAGKTAGGFGESLKSIKQQAERSGFAGESSLIGLVRGAGALAGVSQLSQGLQRLPDIAASVRDYTKTGDYANAAGMVTAEVLPVAGELGKGLRSTYDLISGQYSAAYEKDKKKQEKLDEEARRKAIAQQRQQFMDTSKAATNSAIDADYVASAKDADKGVAAARAALRQVQDEIDKAKRDQGSNLSDADRTQFERDNRARTEAATHGVERAEDEASRIKKENARQTGIEVADIEAQARAANLAALGKDAEAEAVLRVRANAKAVEQINHDFDEQRRQGLNPDPAQRDRLIAAQKRSAEIAKTAADDQERQRQDEKRLGFADKGIDQLQQMADLGLGITRDEADRLKIQEDAIAKVREYNELLKRENLTPAERALLEAQRAGVGIIAAEQLRRVGEGKFSGGLSPTEQSRFLTGVAAASKEDDPTRKLVKLAEDDAATQKAISDGISKMNAALSNIAVYKGRGK